jgi:hypothetical protein
VRSREAFARAEQWLAGPEAAGLGHAVLEKQLAARGREIRRRLLQDHLDARAAAEPRRERVSGPDQITRTRAEAGHVRPLASVFGPVRVSRIAYRAAGPAGRRRFRGLLRPAPAAAGRRTRRRAGLVL